MCVLVSIIKRQAYTPAWLIYFLSRREVALCVSHASRAARFFCHRIETKGPKGARVTACRKTFYFYSTFGCLRVKTFQRSLVFFFRGGVTVRCEDCGHFVKSWAQKVFRDLRKLIGAPRKLQRMKQTTTSRGIQLNSYPKTSLNRPFIRRHIKENIYEHIIIAL